MYRHFFPLATTEMASHDSHDEEPFFEFGGSFDLHHEDHEDHHSEEEEEEEEGPTDLFWVASKVDDGTYAADTMFFVVAPLQSSSEEDLHTAEYNVIETIDTTIDCPIKSANDLLSVPLLGYDPKCYNLEFDTESFQSVFKMTVPAGVEAVAVFTEHVPQEFGEPHFLVEVSGHEISPDFELHHEEHSSEEDDKAWEALGASFVVLLVSLVGVIFLAPRIASLKGLHSARFDAVMYSFSAGALLSTAFFLVLFEPTHLLEAVYSDETDIVWRWGTAILAGYIASPALGSLFVMLETKLFGSNKSLPEDPEDSTPRDEENTIGDVSSEEAGEQDSKSPSSEKQLEITNKHADLDMKRRVLFSILVGDSMHSFVDGVFIGVGFQQCSQALGWTIAWTTVFHELAPELADYQLLVHVVKLSPFRALAANFASGIFVMVGALVAVLADVDDEATAIILCFGGGVYLQLGASEAMPRVYESARTATDKLWALFSFIFASVCIGLVLLDHEHCEAAHDHHGHDEGGHGGHH